MKLYSDKRMFFPNPSQAGPEGLVCISENLSVERLLEAYSFGIFPWPHDGYPLLWFSPPERGILEFKNLHLSTSLKKMIRKCTWKITANQAFEEVLEGCSHQPRPGQKGTWINREMK
ncbi:MAG: leucyl/phenylalanyl-tRNA--protein transferase, partial [Bdellovibrionales bacterium]|nr:leucyl/phenylalanyl-tRNA--protein transferase [Bdellovibrionales bacterium]